VLDPAPASRDIIWTQSKPSNAIHAPHLTVMFATLPIQLSVPPVQLEPFSTLSTTPVLAQLDIIPPQLPSQLQPVQFVLLPAKLVRLLQENALPALMLI